MGRYEWPTQEAAACCREIGEKNETIQSMTDTCYYLGINEQNVQVIEKLTPKIKSLASSIQHCARLIMAELPPPEDRSGRFPKWYTVALDTKLLAMDIHKAAQGIERELVSNRMIVVGAYLEVIRNKCHCIDEQVDIIPCNRVAGPEMFRETIEEIFEGED